MTMAKLFKDRVIMGGQGLIVKNRSVDALALLRGDL
jgi:hypothetical protein